MLQIGGLTLIEHAAKAAEDSGLVDIIVVSSDDPAILEHANSLGFVVAHHRDASAANETSSPGDVIRDLFDTDRDDVFMAGSNPAWLVYLKPTSPLRNGKHILSAFEKLVNYPEIDSIVSVSSEEPHKANGAIYIVSYPEFLKTGALPVPETLSVEMSAEASLKIRNKDDLKKAEALLS